MDAALGYVVGTMLLTAPVVVGAYIVDGRLLRTVEKVGGVIVEWLTPTPRPAANLDHLLTRPTCAPGECQDFEFLVRECEWKASQVGGLEIVLDMGRDDSLKGRRTNWSTEGATKHFRLCLEASGLSWESCRRGESECRLLWRFYGGALPSFLTARPDEPR